MIFKSTDFLLMAISLVLDVKCETAAQMHLCTNGAKAGSEPAADKLNKTLEHFILTHDQNDQSVALGNNRHFKLPFASIYDVKLHNIRHLKLRESDTTIECQDDQVQVHLGIAFDNPHLTVQFNTDMKLKGTCDVTLEHFAADIHVTIPHQEGQKATVDSVQILEMRNIKLNIETSVKVQGFDINSLANSFMKSTPNKEFYPMIEAIIRQFVQMYIDENHIGM